MRTVVLVTAIGTAASTAIVSQLRNAGVYISLGEIFIRKIRWLPARM